MESSKIMMAHIATEIIVIGGISFLFHKRISELNTKVAELEKKLEKCEGCSGGDSSGITEENFTQFQQATTQHINNIYTAIRQIASTINDKEDGTSTHRNLQNPSRGSINQTRESRETLRKRVKAKNHSDENKPILSLTSENNQTKIDVIYEEEQKDILDEDLDCELEDELKDLSNTPLDANTENSATRENSIKEGDCNTTQSDQETPLEFIPTKGKKLVKKKREQ